MGSKARNVLLGIAGGIQGYQQAAKMERDQETQKLKEKFMQLQIEEMKDKLVNSGVERENEAKFRLMIKDKQARGEKITPEDIAQFSKISESVKLYDALLKPVQPKIHSFGPEQTIMQETPEGLTALFQTGPKTVPSKLLSPEEEEQKVRIGQATQRPRLLTPEEEAQQTRIVGAKAAAVQAEKPLESGVQKELLATEKILDNARMALINFDENFVGPGAARKGAMKESFGETPIIGRLVGGPISEKETTFRQSFSALKNAIRNKDFGAALTEFEAAEANKALSDLEKSPTSVRTALRRLGILFNKALERQRMLAITPRRQLKNAPNIQIPEGFVEE